MKTKYYVDYCNTITCYNVIKETPKRIVWINKHGKELSSWKKNDWFDSIDEAADELERRLHINIREHLSNVERKRSVLERMSIVKSDALKQKIKLTLHE